MKEKMKAKIVKKIAKKIPLQNVPHVVTQPNFEHAKHEKHVRRIIGEFFNANNPI